MKNSKNKPGKIQIQKYLNVNPHDFIQSKTLK